MNGSVFCLVASVVRDYNFDLEAEMQNTKPYWVHMLGKTAPYLLCVIPWEARFGAHPTVPMSTWELLQGALATAGIDAAEIERAKTGLDLEGGYVVNSQVWLSDKQIVQLGFAFDLAGMANQAP